MADRRRPVPGIGLGRKGHVAAGLRLSGPVKCLAPDGATESTGQGRNGPSALSGGRAVRSQREHDRMTSETRTERTANLLIARLDALARTADHLPHSDVERLVELASVATMRAVALELLDEERAESIWQEAHSRHPALREVAVALPARAA